MTALWRSTLTITNPPTRSSASRLRSQSPSRDSISDTYPRPANRRYLSLLTAERSWVSWRRVLQVRSLLWSLIKLKQTKKLSLLKQSRKFNLIMTSRSWRLSLKKKLQNLLKYQHSQLKRASRLCLMLLCLKISRFHTRWILYLARPHRYYSLTHSCLSTNY